MRSPASAFRQPGAQASVGPPPSYSRFSSHSWCILRLPRLSLHTTPAAEHAHDAVPPCGDPAYLSKTGSLCGDPKSLITSDGLETPQNTVRCHPIAGAGSCKPWYWCQQYARPMDIMFLLDASNSIGNKWKNLMKVVIALVEELETQVYPLVKCDTSSKNAECDFRMAMQMWGYTNSNNRYHGDMSCNSNKRPIECTTKKIPAAKVAKSNALQIYYADDQIPP